MEEVLILDLIVLLLLFNFVFYSYQNPRKVKKKLFRFWNGGKRHQNVAIWRYQNKLFIYLVAHKIIIMINEIHLLEGFIWKVDKKHTSKVVSPFIILILFSIYEVGVFPEFVFKHNFPVNYFVRKGC